MGKKRSLKNASEEAPSRKNKDSGETEKISRFDFKLGGDIKRSVAGVFLFALAMVLILGFFKKAGVVGESLDSLAGKTIGWVKFIFPLFLIIAGVVLLVKKRTSFYVYKIAGLAVVLFSIAGLIHWFISADEMLKMAQEGGGGGYIGYAISALAIKYFGNAGGLVMIIFLMIAGVIVSFNFSLVDIFAKGKERKNEEAEIPEEIKAEMENEEKEIPKAKLEEDQGKDEKANIAKIEFVAGRDQYVDKKLGEELQNNKFRTKSLANSGSGRRKGQKNKKDEWVLPPLDLLELSSGEAKGGDTEKNAEIIEKTLSHFGIEVERGEIKVGPAVTQYSFRPAVGIKISKILALHNDIALALAAHPIRIEAPIPGKSLIGIEVPNKVAAMVRLRDIFESEGFARRDSDLTLALGKDVSGTGMVVNLDKMPHLLVAGATGTGKSVCINSIITTLLYQNSFKDLKFIMVDPKRVELSLYNGIPHLLSDVVVENGKVVNALRWAVGEMEKRYRIFQDVGSRDLSSYREKVEKGDKRKYKDSETGEIMEEELENLPYIVIIIDELADLMGSHGKEVEGTIVRLAQMARAVGIHLIISTQRPSVEVITGLIKANITTRIAFQVASQIDSRTILDIAGAEKLIGNGDMLFLSATSPKPKRIQGTFVSESEVKRVVKFIKNQKIEEEIGEDIDKGSDFPIEKKISEENFRNKSGKLEFDNVENNNAEDELYKAAKEEVLRMGKASASLLQRRLRIGYSRAARLLDDLEERGVVGPADGAKPREVFGSKGSEPINYEDNAADQGKRDKWEI
jgi:DNA segregation ATPase FtsK/SpoIIIE, S-DNA-T family